MATFIVAVFDFMKSSIVLQITKNDSEVKEIFVPLIIKNSRIIIKNPSRKMFDWEGIFYPIDQLAEKLTNFVMNWKNAFIKESKEDSVVAYEKILSLNEEGIKELKELPDNIGILVENMVKEPK